MADLGDGSQVEGLLTSLEASFDASIDREEQEAASDLAFSLAQGQPFADVLARSGAMGVRLPGGRTAPIAVIGRDYVASAVPATLIPLERVIAVTIESGSAPVSRGDSLVERLRDWARRGTAVEIATQAGSFTGRLALVGPDHVRLDRKPGIVAVALEAVESVRSLREEEP
jgi:hypothetical protein